MPIERKKIVKKYLLLCEGKDAEGVLRAKGEGMNASIMQNPSEPDTTYREKEGSHNGSCYLQTMSIF